MKNFFLAFMCLLFLGGCDIRISTGDEQYGLPAPTPGTKVQQQEAESAARRFLAMIDDGDFQGTWYHAGSAIREQTSELTWKSMLKMTAKTLSGPLQRELDAIGFSTRVDVNAPVGEYALVLFKSDGDCISTIERVVMQKDEGDWKIVGYFVQKYAK